jgi:hypothetical protein
MALCDTRPMNRQHRYICDLASGRLIQEVSLVEQGVMCWKKKKFVRDCIGIDREKWLQLNNVIPGILY